MFRVATSKKTGHTLFVISYVLGRLGLHVFYLWVLLGTLMFEKDRTYLACTDTYGKLVRVFDFLRMIYKKKNKLGALTGKVEVRTSLKNTRICS